MSVTLDAYLRPRFVANTPVTSALRLQRRITVNVIAPGAIATDSAAGWFATTPR